MTEKNYKDEDTLKELYYGQKLSMQGVADKLGCTKSKVRYWLKKHGIKRRSQSQAMAVGTGAPSLETSHHGYEKFQHCYRQNHSVLLVHRLLAVAEYGFGSVCGAEIHHKNGIPWDNRSENIEPLSEQEHKRKHANKHPMTKKLFIMELAENEGMKRREIADVVNIPTSTVCSIAAGQDVGGANV